MLMMRCDGDGNCGDKVVVMVMRRCYGVVFFLFPLEAWMAAKTLPHPSNTLKFRVHLLRPCLG